MILFETAAVKKMNTITDLRVASCGYYSGHFRTMITKTNGWSNQTICYSKRQNYYG